jgi:tetratricopeptide (TPR) repeat protein
MRKGLIALIMLCLAGPAAAAPMTRWMRLHPDVSWNYLRQWETKHQWIAPSREGRELFLVGDIAGAQKSLQSAIAGGSDDGRLYYELGYCRKAEGDPVSAADYFRKAIDRLSVQAPSHLYLFNAHYLLGSILEEQGDNAGALAEFDRALILRPDTATLRYRKAIIYREQGKIDEAVSEIEAALKADPALPPANYLLGLLRLEKEDWAGARGYFEKAAAGNAEVASSRYCLGYIAFREGRTDDAVASYRAALAADANQKEARIALGNIAYEQEKLPEAEEQFRALSAREPNNARWHYNLGVIYRDQEKLDLSEGELARAKELDPNLAFRKEVPGGLKGLSGQAARLYAEGKKEEAARLYRQALLEDPFYLPARYNLAVVYADLGQNGPAVREYGRVIRIEPDYAPAHLNRGILLYRKNRRSGDAAYHFRKYLDLEPKNPQAELIKIYLHEIQGW